MKLVVTVPVQTKACKVEQEKHSPKQKLSTFTTPTSKFKLQKHPGRQKTPQKQQIMTSTTNCNS